MGQFTQTEVQSAKGRSDCVVWTKDALKQIDDKGYAVPYKTEKRKVVKIGAGFDRETCTIDRWIVQVC
jgi:hypothetical protein